MNSKVTTIAGWVLAVVLGGLYIMAGAGKFGGAGAEMFAGWGYAAWFAMLIGVLEVLGGVGLIVPKTTRWAVFGLTGIMLGAAYTHLSNGEGPAVLRPAVFLVLLWVLWWLRRPASGSAPAPSA
jgi:uncharacterized membrane protein YphA (DoxX/SURF4 family)